MNDRTQAAATRTADGARLWTAAKLLVLALALIAATLLAWQLAHVLLLLVGAVLVTGHADDTGTLVVGLVAVVLATMNLVGGFVVTDRMLEMFKGRSGPRSGAGRSATGGEG